MLQINDVSSFPPNFLEPGSLPLPSSPPAVFLSIHGHLLPSLSAKLLPVCAGGILVENAAVPGDKLLRICASQGSPTLKGCVCQAAFGLQWQCGSGFSRDH